MAEILFSELVLTAQIWTYDPATEVWEYRHILGSPRNIGVESRNPEYYCSFYDLLYVGFGFTQQTYVDLLPAFVVANVPFTVQISPRNVFGSDSIQTFDPLKELFTLDFVPMGGECICSPHSS